MKFRGKTYDDKYIELCEYILEHGVEDTNPRPVYADGSPAYSKKAFNYNLTLGPNEIPVLLSKKVFVKKAIDEMLWIWQKRSNVVQDLRNINIKIWDEWELPDGTIGESYGYQMNKIVGDSGLNQVDYLIDRLKNDPDSRRHITNMWDVTAIHKMALTPCVYQTQWSVLDNKLYCNVIIRSNDIALGNVFDVVQYWVLHKLIANETGYEPGDIVFSITNPHIYSRHINTIKDQIERYKALKDYAHEVEIEIEDVDFYEFSSKNVHLNNYDEFANEPLKRYNFEIAI